MGFSWAFSWVSHGFLIVSFFPSLFFGVHDGFLMGFSSPGFVVGVPDWFSLDSQWCITCSSIVSYFRRGLLLVLMGFLWVFSWVSHRPLFFVWFLMGFSWVSDGQPDRFLMGF